MQGPDQATEPPTRRASETEPPTQATEHRLAALMRDTPQCRLRFRPVCELTEQDHSTDWLWRGFIAKGGLTVLAGQPKVGKSTLLFALLAARSQDSALLGQTVSVGRTLLLSEEREGTLAEKAQLFSLREGLDILCRHEVRGLSWPEIIGDALIHCSSEGIDLLVIDTFDKWGCHDENNPGQVVEALHPLMAAASEGLGVVLVHHQRKSPGSYGEAVRGSNALTGGVDVIIELERANNIRVLRSVSRYRDTPAEVFANLCGDHFVTVDFEEEEIPPYLPFSATVFN
jgi:predicted ATP-dependent serine protease